MSQDFPAIGYLKHWPPEEEGYTWILWQQKTFRTGTYNALKKSPFVHPTPELAIEQGKHRLCPGTVLFVYKVKKSDKEGSFYCALYAEDEELRIPHWRA